jgi:hypothetical protein
MRPRSRQKSTTAVIWAASPGSLVLRSLTSSTPISSLLPRTSPTTWWLIRPRNPVDQVGAGRGPSGIAAFKGDKAWAAAIHVTIFMPIGVILSAVALAIMSPDAKVGPSILCGLLEYILAGVVAVTALIIIG